MKGYVHSIESFGSSDGPGVRFIVFLTGCTLRCRYCHNPDTWEMSKGTLTEADELIKKSLRYKNYWGENGGITISGGEPLLQPDFLIDILKKAHDNGINTAIDTAGAPFHTSLSDEKFEEIMKYTDTVLLDIKHIDEDEHVKLTGSTGVNIKEMAERLSDMNKPVWIRYVLVPGINDSEEYLLRLRDFLSKLKNIQKIDVLPYHTLGVFKWEQLGLKYTLDGVNPPDGAMVDKVRNILMGKSN